MGLQTIGHNWITITKSKGKGKNDRNRIGTEKLFDKI